MRNLSCVSFIFSGGDLVLPSRRTQQFPRSSRNVPLPLAISLVVRRVPFCSYRFLWYKSLWKSRPRRWSRRIARERSWSALEYISPPLPVLQSKVVWASSRWRRSSLPSLSTKLRHRAQRSAEKILESGVVADAVAVTISQQAMDSRRVNKTGAGGTMALESNQRRGSQCFGLCVSHYSPHQRESWPSRSTRPRRRWVGTWWLFQARGNACRDCKIWASLLFELQGVPHFVSGPSVK